MYQITVKLKQHTPLIHFQHDQEGATLRASEVKPRLDKFILKEYGLERAKKDHWLVGKGAHPALDYKLKIVSSDPKNIAMRQLEKRSRGVVQRDELGQSLFTTANYPDNSNSLVMGNMGGRIQGELLNFVMFDSVVLNISVGNAALNDYIREKIYDFFLETNFGNRKSKGFGSFLVESVDGQIVDKKLSCDWSISFDLQPSEGRSQSFGFESALKDVFIMVNKVWRGLKKYGQAPKNQLKSVFLGRKSNLTDNEERIPSPIYFKPVIRPGRACWNVVILMFLSLDVIDKAGANVDDFYNLMDSAVDRSSDFYKEFRDLGRDGFSNEISNIKIQ